MPVLGRDSANITLSFRENWLNAGGLGLIMNILLPDTLPNNADYELRQSCYYIILQLARFLLCGELNDHQENVIPPPSSNQVVRTYGQTSAVADSVTPMNCSFASQAESQMTDVSMTSSTPIKVTSNNASLISQNAIAASSWPGARGSINDSPGSANQFSSSPGSAASFTPEGSLRKRLRSTSSVLETVSPTVKMVVENINEEEFNEIISSLVQVSWAAAAGQLQLNTKHATKIDEFSPFSQSPHSTNDDFKAGLCLRQETVSIMDSVLANNSLELLVMCLQLRPKLMDMFYKLPNISAFIVDILTGSPSIEVRNAASMHFFVLASSNIQTMTVDSHPKAFFNKIITSCPVACVELIRHHTRKFI